MRLIPGPAQSVNLREGKIAAEEVLSDPVRAELAEIIRGDSPGH